MYVCVACVYVSVDYAHAVPEEPVEGIRTFETGITHGCESMLEPNLDPLLKWQVLLTAALSLQSEGSSKIL